MNSRWLKLLFWISLSSISFTVQGEDLLSLFQYARLEDTTFQAAVQRALADQEVLPQAQAALLPHLNFSATRAKNHDSTLSTPYQSANFYPRNYALNLNQPLFYYDRWMQVKEAQSQEKSIRMDLALAEQTLILQLAERYFGCLKAEDVLAFVTAQRNAYHQDFQQAKQRHQVGLISDIDMALAQAKYDKIAAQEVIAQSELAHQKALLKEMVGERWTGILARLQESLPLSPPSPKELSAWLHIALQKNLAVQSARFKADAAKAHIKTEQSGHLPQLNLVGSLSRNQKTPPSSLNHTARSSSLGVQLTVPLFSGGAVLSKGRQAAHQYEQARQSLENLSRQTETETRNAYEKVLAQMRNIQALRQAIQSSQSALRATKAAFEVGTKTIGDVLDAQKDLVQAKKDYAEARYTYVLESLRLKKATGILSPEDLKQINDWLKA